MALEGKTDHRAEKRIKSCRWHVLEGLAQETRTPVSMQNWGSYFPYGLGLAECWMVAGKKKLERLPWYVKNSLDLQAKKLSRKQA